MYHTHIIGMRYQSSVLNVIKHECDLCNTMLNVTDILGDYRLREIRKQKLIDFSNDSLLVRRSLNRVVWVRARLQHPKIIELIYSLAC